MTSSKEKSVKIPFITSSAVIILLLVYLFASNFFVSKSTSSCTAPKSIDKSIFAGEWTVDWEYDKFELNSDSATFSLYLHGSKMHIKGHWEIIDMNINNEKTSIIVLKNEIPPIDNTSHQEGYFKFYFFSIDKVVNRQIFLTDLSSENTVRRNKQYTLKQK